MIICLIRYDWPPPGPIEPRIPLYHLDKARRTTTGIPHPDGGYKKNTDERGQQTERPRDRLSRLSEASLRINESLDLDTVLQEILDSARSLTDARCGVIVSLDDKGQVRTFWPLA